MFEDIKPGVYEIAPLIAENMGLSIWEGLSGPGAEIKLNGRDANAPIMLFEITPSLSPGSSERINGEYNIISKLSGLLLASNSDTKVTVEDRPRHDRNVCWMIVPAKNGTFYITNMDGRKQLSVRDSGTKPGTAIIAGNFSERPGCEFWLKQAQFM